MQEEAPQQEDELRAQFKAAFHKEMPGCTHDEYGDDCGGLVDAAMEVVSGRDRKPVPLGQPMDAFNGLIRCPADMPPSVVTMLTVTISSAWGDFQSLEEPPETAEAFWNFLAEQRPARALRN